MKLFEKSRSKWPKTFGELGRNGGAQIVIYKNYKAHRRLTLCIIGALTT